MASKAARAKIGELPPLEVTDLEHQGAAAAAAAIAEVAELEDDTKDAGTAGGTETPLSPSADDTRDRSASPAAPASPATSQKRGRGRPKGSRTRNRSLTAEHLEGRSRLRAELEERDRKIAELQSTIDELQVATAGQDEQLVNFTRELVTTASGTAVLLLKDGRWMLNPEQIQRLGELGAPVARKYLGAASHMSPELALLFGVGAIVLEKMQEPPQPLDSITLVP